MTKDTDTGLKDLIGSFAGSTSGFSGTIAGFIEEDTV